MEDGLVRNTLAFRFPPGSPAPSLVETARFVKHLDADLDSMETTYKLVEEQCLCVKFKTLEAMKEAQAQIPEIVTFRYSNGEKIEVKVSVAGCHTKYLRIFDLPPEVPDSEISAVLSRYGSVKRMVRERFPADLGLNMYTGVRGVYLDIKKVVPASLYFLSRKGRIYYDGLKQKCFLCKEEGHLKVDCPQKAKRKGESRVAPIVEQSADGAAGDDTNSSLSERNKEERVQPENRELGLKQAPSYSGVLSGARPVKVKESVVANMVTLVSERNKGHEQTGAKVEQAVSSVTVETESDSEMDAVAAAKSGIKRQHSTGGSTGETDDENQAGFRKAEGNRKSSRVAKKMLTPIEQLSSVPLHDGKGKRSSSK